MKKMIRMAAFAAAMFVATTTVAKAQGGGNRGGRGGPNPVVILKDSLHVSAEVATKAEEIYKNYQAEAMPLMEAARGGDADARTKMTAARTKMTEQIKALLTDEQKAKFDAMMPAGRRGGGH